MKPVCVIFCIVFLFIPLHTYADTLPDASALEDCLPEEVREYGISTENPGEGITVANVFGAIVSIAASVFSEQAESLCICGGILLLLYFLSRILPAENKSLLTTVCNVAAFGCVAVFFTSVFDGASSLRNSLERVTAFGQAIVPLLFGAVSASGRVQTAAGASVSFGILFAALTFIGQTLILPLTETFYAVGICGSVLKNPLLARLSHGFKSLCITVICACGFVFSLVVGLNSAAAASTDSLSAKTLGYAVANGIPFVGGGLAESAATVIESARAVGSGIGVLGCGVVLFLLLRPLVTCFVMILLCGLLATFADMLYLESMKNFFTVSKDVFTVLDSVAAVAGVTVIISLGVVFK